MDRTCVNCGKVMQPLKNGFHFLWINGKVYSSDLWGCRSCGKVQIHGIPRDGGPWYPVHAHAVGMKERDEESLAPDTFECIRSGSMWFTTPFWEHMREWYPEWKAVKLWI